MLEQQCDQLLPNAVGEVLESMFFSAICEMDVVDQAENLSLISADLSFRGNPSGFFGVQTSVQTAQKLAANFLGQDEASINESQSGEVLCELANMLCGSSLSRLESGERFELSAPVWRPAAMPSVPDRLIYDHLFQTDEGSLHVWMGVEERP